jgi:hypothetical protein
MISVVFLSDWSSRVLFIFISEYDWHAVASLNGSRAYFRRCASRLWPICCLSFFIKGSAQQIGAEKDKYASTRIALVISSGSDRDVSPIGETR